MPIARSGPAARKSIMARADKAAHSEVGYTDAVAHRQPKTRGACKPGGVHIRVAPARPGAIVPMATAAPGFGWRLYPGYSIASRGTRPGAIVTGAGCYAGMNFNASPLLQ